MLPIKWPTFEEWLGAVDAILRARLGGLAHDALPEQNWRAAFESGNTPTEAVNDALSGAYMGDIDAVGEDD